MAKYRHVHTAFWEDPKVLEEMTPEDKYFYLYLLTNPKTTQIGVYAITKKQMAFDLGYSTESVTALLDRFINNHRLINYNEETRELAIIKWAKYNLNKAGKPVEDCVKKELQEVKDVSLLLPLVKHMPNAKVKKIYEDFLNSGEVYFEPSKTAGFEKLETITVRDYVIFRDKQTCFYTGVKLRLDDIEIDHVIPRVSQGSSDPGNLVVTSRKLNGMKSGWDLKEFCEVQGLDYFLIVDKVNELKSFEKERRESEVTQREAIENGIYDTFTLRKYIDTIRGQKEKEKEKEKENKKEKEEEENPTTAFQFYEENFGMLSPYLSQEIGYWLDDFNNQHDIIIEAFKISVERNKRTWGYTKAILKDWHVKGAKTLDDVHALQNEQKPKVNVGTHQKQNSLFKPSEETLERQRNLKQLSDEEKQKVADFEEELEY